MIKTVIFDIGNVLAGFAWKEYFDRFSYSEEVKERIGKATVQSVAWNEYDKGNLSDEEVVEAFVRNDPGIEKELRESLDNISGMLVRYDYAIPWVRALKESGYQVLVLSNFSHKAVADCGEVLDFLPLTDGGILSYKEHMIKPQPEIYELLIRRYGLEPEECVFMDDTPVNVEAAQKAGIHGIHFRNKEQAEKELHELGITY